MKRSEYYHYQRDVLEPLHQFNKRELDLHYISYVVLDVPKGAEQVFRQILEDEYVSIHNESSFLDLTSFTLDSGSSEDNLGALQLRLMDERLPHTFFLQNSDDNWRRADFRMKDGEFMVHRVSDYSEVMDTHFITNALEQQAFTALMIAAKKKQASAASFDFTEEDRTVLKPRILRAIVEAA